MLDGVRTHALVDGSARLDAADHVCWVYDDPGELAAVSGRFLGAAVGDRLLYIGTDVGPAATGLPDAEAAIAQGRLELRSVADAYGRAGSAFDPQTQLASYASDVRRAQHAGYRGIRVVADVTEIVQDPARRAAFARWEHLVDEYAAQEPGFAVLCAYHRSVGPQIVSDTASVHPVVRADEPVPFRIFFDDDRLVLAGEIDLAVEPRLSRVLRETHLDRPVDLDLRRLEFADTATVAAIGRWAAAYGPDRVRLIGASRLFRRMWDVLDLGRESNAVLTGATG